MPDTTEALHLLFVESEDGLWMTSPQVPSLAYSTPSGRIDQKDVQAALRYAGAPKAPHAVHVIHEFVAEDGTEYSVRVASDQHRDERVQVARRLTASLLEPHSEVLAQQPTGPIPEIQFVCVLPSDQIGWVIDQLMPGGDVVSLVAPVSDQMVWVQALGHNVAHPEEDGWQPLGLDRGDTVSDLMVRQAAATRSKPPPLLI